MNLDKLELALLDSQRRRLIVILKSRLKGI
jgi:hypothetical protein